MERPWKAARILKRAMVLSSSWRIGSYDTNGGTGGIES